jgi:hypothetical protein
LTPEKGTAKTAAAGPQAKGRFSPVPDIGKMNPLPTQLAQLPTMLAVQQGVIQRKSLKTSFNPVYSRAARTLLFVSANNH